MVCGERMTTELDNLYRAVLEAPDRDGPRRQYARYLENQGDELGEYIRLALDWDRKRLATHADVARALELHNKLRARQTAPLERWIRSHQRDRGLVALVEMDGRSFVEHGDEVFALAPIQHLDLVESKAVFAEVVQSPILGRVQTLNLYNNDLGDKEAALLAASPHLQRLLALDLSRNKIGLPGLEAIASSPNLPSMKRFNFDHNLVDSPVAKWSSDGVSGLTHYEGAGSTQDLLEKKYGIKKWMHPSEGDQNLDRFRLCDASE
jgi:uncharacterized protein (TIGR02996 family)